MKNGDLPANPINIGSGIYKGITKREYFAAMAIQGLCSIHNQDGESTYNASHGIGQEAVNIADDLLIALEKNVTKQ